MGVFLRVAQCGSDFSAFEESPVQGDLNLGLACKVRHDGDDRPLIPAVRFGRVPIDQLSHGDLFVAFTPHLQISQQISARNLENAKALIE